MIGNLLTLLQVTAGFTFVAFALENFFQRRALVPVRVSPATVQRALDAR